MLRCFGILDGLIDVVLICFSGFRTYNLQYFIIFHVISKPAELFDFWFVNSCSNSICDIGLKFENFRISPLRLFWFFSVAFTFISSSVGLIGLMKDN